MTTAWDPAAIDRAHLDLLLAGGHSRQVVASATAAQEEADRLRHGLGDHVGTTIAIEVPPVPPDGQHQVLTRPILPLVGEFAGYWEALAEIGRQAAAARSAAPWRPGHVSARFACTCWSGRIVAPEPLGEHAASIATWLETHLSAETYELTVPTLDGEDLCLRFVTPAGEPHQELFALFARRFRPTATWHELWTWDEDRAQLERGPVVRQREGGYILRRPGTDTAALQVRLADLLRHDFCRPTIADLIAGRMEASWEPVGRLATRLDDVVVDCLHALLDASGGTTTDVFLPWGTYPDEEHLVDQINQLLRGSPYVVEAREIMARPPSFRLRLARPDEIPYQGALDLVDPVFPLLPHHTLDFVHQR